MVDDDSSMDDEARTLAALKCLPESLLQVLLLCEVRKLTMEQAAIQLGLSRAAVERRWTQAVMRLTEVEKKLGG